MKLSEFITECDNFEYSKEYFELYKEACELDVMELWLECQDASLYNQEENIYEESYFMEADESKKEDIQNKVDTKKENFFKRIWKNIVSLFRRFWNWVKSFFSKNTLKEDIQKTQEASTKAAEHIKQIEMKNGKSEKEAEKIAEEKIESSVVEALKALDQKTRDLVINGTKDVAVKIIKETEIDKKMNPANWKPRKQTRNVNYHREKTPIDRIMNNENRLHRISKGFEKYENVPTWIKQIFTDSSTFYGAFKGSDVLTISIHRHYINVPKYREYASGIDDINVAMEEFISTLSENNSLSNSDMKYVRGLMSRMPSICIYLTGEKSKFYQSLNKISEKINSLADTKPSVNPKIFTKIIDLFNKVIPTTIEFHIEIRKAIKRCANQIYKYYAKLYIHKGTDITDEAKNHIIKNIKGLEIA